MLSGIENVYDDLSKYAQTDMDGNKINQKRDMHTMHMHIEKNINLNADTGGMTTSTHNDKKHLHR